MKTPVLIVGGGPVGLALAGDLGWRGISCLLVEKGDGSVDNPKMDIVHPRAMEFCRRWGIVPWVENGGYNRNYPQDYIWVTALNGGYELGREPNPANALELPPPQSPQKRERCPQNFFDPVLARHARSYRHVTLRHETELVDFSEHEDGVSATIVDLKTGERTSVEAQYLIGCDGAGSLIREKLGVSMTGNSVLTYTTNAIFRSDELAGLNQIKPGYRYIFIGPEGTWCTIVAIDGRNTYRFSLVGNQNRNKLSDADIRAAIERAVGCPFRFDILSTMPWTRRELVADSYGTKRIFLVGDSAHQLSPTGGFGMNTGIQEAVDISWKLEACLRGWGGAGLLASYEAERKPVAARNVREAARNLDRMLASRQTKPPEAVFRPGPEGDAARRAYGDWYTRMMAPEWFTIGIQLGFRYESSPIIVPDGTPAPPDDPARYVQTARPGHRAPHVWMQDGRSTLDLYGRGFVLLRTRAAPPDVGGLVEAAKTRGVPLSIVDVFEMPVWEAYERELILVRPDGHVAWRGDESPADPLAVIDRIRGAN
ncbi:FAD-dependent oxidoreductase [Roseiarcaceae bacterium H3SJ34-1]|uniref:FAD-dependent oxidoreductase n=1 Tax=Terripilifer ovatus TaxID=3032367 RepID=UPI003AB95E74|nr:FAD-dependent oxidoreductase [Roseiarcaceae bacterium H3SJ34-1]